MLPESSSSAILVVPTGSSASSIAHIGNANFTTYTQHKCSFKNVRYYFKQRRWQMIFYVIGVE